MKVTSFSCLTKTVTRLCLRPVAGDVEMFLFTSLSNGNSAAEASEAAKAAIGAAVATVAAEDFLGDLINSVSEAEEVEDPSLTVIVCFRLLDVRGLKAVIGRASPSSL